tara:strand:- start:4388 stop:4618 length:231 start_codon:yes stop_codon:yes gene_type:complete
MLEAMFNDAEKIEEEPNRIFAITDSQFKELKKGNRIQVKDTLNDVTFDLRIRFGVKAPENFNDLKPSMLSMLEVKD